ncbi:MAG: branched-chain amino acid ABC transporter substrate-binding protein, partial [Desulfitobacteriaceae bacterium]|nr:branched-chain amino acid ABC transporter substrate-binding protein [Desulfitobacteriaceae bacterium]
MRKCLASTTVLCLMLALVPIGCAREPKAVEPIKIGIQGPLTGSWAFEGQEGMVKPIQMLADQVNSQGGLLGGRKIELVIVDDKGDPKEAALAAQKLVNEGANFVIGSYASNCTEPATPIYERAGILSITPIATAVRLTQHGYKHFFRTCMPDDRQGEFAAQFIVERLGKTKVALLHDNTTYAKGLADAAKAALTAKGATIVFFDAVNPGEKDFTAVLAKMKAAKPDVWYYTGFWAEAALLAKQRFAAGLGAQMMVGNACTNKEFVEMAGVQNAKGIIATMEPKPEDLEYPEAKKFMSDFKARYGDLPGSIWAAFSADAFLVLVEAIKGSNSTDADAVADYLR